MYGQGYVGLRGEAEEAGRDEIVISWLCGAGVRWAMIPLSRVMGALAEKTRLGELEWDEMEQSRAEQTKAKWSPSHDGT